MLLLATYLVNAVPVRAQDAPPVTPVAAPAEAAPAATPATINDVINNVTQDTAQGAAADAGAVAVAPEATPAQKLILLNENEIDPTQIPSILFTYWEYSALQDAKKARGLVRAPTQNELLNSMDTPLEANRAVDPGIRELSLGGIVYTQKGDWTIWLNKTMVTPKALPKEAIDLVVKREYIDVKWFDAYTNQIFPVRLRPHQRFNLDTRIFLPGEG